jgi:L-lysine exporter family protein LysE/ArgO
MVSLKIFVTGFFSCLALLFGIGPQNAFILRQGLAGSRVGIVALIFVLGDVLLISLGVFGVGATVSENAMLMKSLTIGGSLLLIALALSFVHQAMRSAVPAPDSASQESTLLRVAGTAAALSFLNPYAIMDTTIILGAAGAALPPDLRFVFAAGAIAASILWFPALGYFAKSYGSLLRQKAVWRTLNVGFAGLMLVLAGRLISI